MRKLAVKRKPARKKRGASPLDTLFAGVDMSMLRRLLADELPLEEETLEEMVDRFVSLEPREGEDMSKLSDALERARIDANGGDPEARETLKAVREKIDKAARRDEIHPGVLILLGRLFAESQVDIGDGARALMGRMVAADLFREPGEEAYSVLVQPLLTDLASDPFTLHHEIGSLISIFPLNYKAALVECLAADSKALAHQAAVGFLLDPDEPIALAAVRGLAASAAQSGLDAACRQRVDRIRPWLAPPRRAALDAAIPPVERAAPRLAAQVVKTRAGACDGSGAAILLATVKQGAGFSVITLMTKSTGVADSFLFEDVPKSEAAAIERGAISSTPSAEISLAAWTRMVQLALGRNLASGPPPPFELVRALETIEVDSLIPETATPADILDSALAGVRDCDGPEALIHAHESIVDSDVASDWFEAGEAVEAVLNATDSIEEGAQALIEGYLPRRRDFWASQCALSALALKEGDTRGSRTLALVGRDIISGAPLNDIPLMLQIAERSATAFFMWR